MRFLGLGIGGLSHQICMSLHIGTNNIVGGSINIKEMNQTIKKLQRNKSTGPDDIPNELFIEANEETKETLKAMIENVHNNEEIPPAWAEG